MHRGYIDVEDIVRNDFTRVEVCINAIFIKLIDQEPIFDSST